MFTDAPPLDGSRLRGLVADSASVVMGTLRDSWLTAFCVLGIIFFPLMCLPLRVREPSAYVGPQNQTLQVLAC